jgi:hypothetical protein
LENDFDEENLEGKEVSNTEDITDNDRLQQRQGTSNLLSNEGFQKHLSVFFRNILTNY